MRELLTHLSHEKEVLDIGRRIQSEVHEKMNKSQRDYVLRQQLNAIKKELGEDEEPAPETDDYTKRLETIKDARRGAQGSPS